MSSPKDLKIRIATIEDKELLLGLRLECGWGGDKVQLNLGKDNYPYCIFTLGSDETQVVGMAGWVLELERDPETASRDRKTVYLTSLFIRRAYQGSGLGSKAMDLLEQTAKERFGAEWITLDTAQWKNEQVGEFLWVEHIGVEARNPRWYAARGYLPYRDPIPFFHCPTAEDPEHRLTAAFLRKPASAVFSTSVKA